MPEPTLESGAGKFDVRTEYEGGAPLSTGRLGAEDMPVDKIGGAYTGDNFHPILPPEKRTHIQLRPEDIPPEARTQRVAPEGTRVVNTNTLFGGGDYIDFLTNEGWYRGQSFKLSEDEDLAVRRVIVRAIKRQLKEQNARIRASLHEGSGIRKSVQAPLSGGEVDVRGVSGSAQALNSEAEDVGA